LLALLHPRRGSYGLERRGALGDLGPAPPDD
jgi:hypothetical protein